MGKKLMTKSEYLRLEVIRDNAFKLFKDINDRRQIRLDDVIDDDDPIEFVAQTFSMASHGLDAFEAFQ